MLATMPHWMRDFAPVAYAGGETDLKSVLIVLLVLGFLGFLAWLAKRLPTPFSWLAWAVLAIVAFFVVIRFVQGL